VAKKKTPAKKSVRGKKSTARKIKSAADTSRLDTGPLQEHIRKRIKDLEGKYKASRQADDGTLERLRVALDTLEDICWPSMTVPI
jgi:hypothetical protein